MNKQEFEALSKEFLLTLGTSKDEFWTTERSFADEILDRFIQWNWAEDIEKETRYTMHLKLKEEFGEVS